MNITINLDGNYNKVRKSLTAFAEKQLPFALAQALNATGADVVDAERDEIKKQFPTATPFTIKSVGLSKARKGDTEVTVYVKDIAATYLLPYLEGGKHHLNSRALLNPKDIGVNAYGNLPRNTLQRLKSRSDVFIGAVKTKNGDTIHGVWQRIGEVKARSATKRAPARQGKPAHLKLLIRFGDALPVKQHLDWEAVARATVAAVFDKHMGHALARAIATAKV